jgi:hypothetical protein
VLCVVCSATCSLSILSLFPLSFLSHSIPFAVHDVPFNVSECVHSDSVCRVLDWRSHSER